MHILKYGDLLDVPWKNGGGVTRNIASGLLDDRVVWSISRADVVQDGPFSDFTGMQRVLTVVSGGEMTLISPARSLEAKLWEPVWFDGAVPIRSELRGDPLTDLNLMFRPTHCTATVKVLRGTLDQSVSCPPQGFIAYHALAGTARINTALLDTADTVISSGSQMALSLGPDDAVLEIRLTYLDQSADIRLCIPNR
tara:strand:+ start:618 stop:1205 length:588 start_codon:yes stop_codon:yes gene_type:complete